MLIMAGLTFLSCKKEKKEEVVPDPTPTVPVVAVFGDGFKVEDNLNQTVIADSSRAFTSTGSKKFFIESYKGEFPNIELVFKTATISAKTYPLDSLNKDQCAVMYGMWGYEIKSGSVVISSVSSTRVSGTFTFQVQQEVGTSTRTEVRGTFNNVKVK